MSSRSLPARAHGAALAALLALLLTPARPAHAYRTAADLPEFPDGERVRWFADTIEYEISDWLPPELERAAVEEAVARAFDAWAAPSCSSLTFVSRGFTNTSAAFGDGLVTVQWVGQGWTTILGLDPDAAATTEIAYQTDAAGRWLIVDADIYVNAERFTWSTADTPDERDVQAVMTHEIGHVVGLLHNEADAGSVMYPEYLGLDQRMLSADDVSGVCYLYAPAACTTDGCPEGTECTYEGCVTWCDEALCRPGQRCGPGANGCTSEPCSPGSCERGCEETCATTGGAFGDPCASGLECWSGYCSVAGYCTTLCETADDCGPEARCDFYGDPPECVPEAGILGEPCDQAADCVTGLCLTGATTPPICTRECGDGPTGACPPDYECTTVEATPVCAPPPGGGVEWCEVTPGHSRRAPWQSLLALVVLVLGARIRRPAKRRS